MHVDISFLSITQSNPGQHARTLSSFSISRSWSQTKLTEVCQKLHHQNCSPSTAASVEGSERKHNIRVIQKGARQKPPDRICRRRPRSFCSKISLGLLNFTGDLSPEKSQTEGCWTMFWVRSDCSSPLLKACKLGSTSSILPLPSSSVS